MSVTVVGVDVGGTFTDVVVASDGVVSIHKLPSTEDQDEAVVEGLERGTDRRGIDPGEVGSFVHGTTVATNAVLEGELPDAGLVTTEGFRDVLEIGRQNRPEIYDLEGEKPSPVVPRRLRFGVGERVGPSGEVLRGLDEGGVREAARRLAEEGVESVGVCFIHSFENPGHEEEAGEVLEEEGLEVSLSSRVFPEIREYERSAATALNAALVPVVKGYLEGLVDGIRCVGLESEVWVHRSAGGLLDAGEAGERPVETLLSGPAAGVEGARFVAGLAGEEDILTMDMGGTSCDVSAVPGGEVRRTRRLGVAGYEAGVPSVDMETVGAGGGSVVWVDEGGSLRVGPGSAGSRPGPICYGRGGERPTVTDAHYLLKRIEPEEFLEGLVPGRSEVREAFGELGEEVGMSPEEVALGALEVANASMAGALRVVSVERGLDPRRFALVPFGGAGPLHGVEVAERLGTPRGLVPRFSGVLSAVGLAAGEPEIELSRSLVRSTEDLDLEIIKGIFEEFSEEAEERLGAEAVLERSLDLRYAGQSHELTLPLPEVSEKGMEEAERDFHDLHRRRYGHSHSEEAVELVTLRMEARLPREPPEMAFEPEPGASAIGRREVLFEGGGIETEVHRWERLEAGSELRGPVVIEGESSTALVPPGASGRVDQHGNLALEVSR